MWCQTSSDHLKSRNWFSKHWNICNHPALPSNSLWTFVLKSSVGPTSKPCEGLSVQTGACGHMRNFDINRVICLKWIEIGICYVKTQLLSYQSFVSSMMFYDVLWCFMMFHVIITLFPPIQAWENLCCVSRLFAIGMSHIEQQPEGCFSLNLATKVQDYHWESLIWHRKPRNKTWNSLIVATPGGFDISKQF